MARRQEAEMHYIHRRWKEKLFDPEFRDKSYKDQGLEFGVSGATISNWRNDIEEPEWNNILKISRERIAKQSFEVDSALYRRAKEGDVPAIKLWKESMEGWSPKQINENLNRNSGIEDMTEEQKLELVMGDADLGVVERILAKKKAEKEAGVIDLKEANGENP